MKGLVLLALVASVVFAVKISEEDHKKAFASWKLEHPRDYSANDDIKLRFELFKQYRNEVFDHNEKAQQGIYTWTKRVDRFADWTAVEKSRFLAYVPDNGTTSPEALIPYNNTNADYIDWTQRGAVVNGKDQRNCGSCWAFAATGTMEGCNAIAGRGLKRLSEQQLQDCLFSHRCSPGGGGPKEAIEWVIGRGGISEEGAYPYLARDGGCHDAGKAARVGAALHAYQNEGAMINLVNRGPTAVGINGESLFGYHDGVINDDRKPKNTNHAIIIVGYAPRCKGTNIDCWIVRNSWGSGWGQGGFALIARNRNMLGIGNDAHVAINC